MYVCLYISADCAMQFYACVCISATFAQYNPIIRAWKEGGCRRGIVAQWQSTGGSSQRPWDRFPAAPLFLSSPCRFKGLQTVEAPIVSFVDTITIGLWTTEGSCPSDSSTAVITLNNFSHQLTHTAITLHLSIQSYVRVCMFVTLVQLFHNSVAKMCPWGQLRPGLLPGLCGQYLMEEHNH